ncbi:membrane hypothetical protein [Candidatus Sulfotelmatomonas gaucii]|uniref:Uncharacterized protein n=1 Tax=Candidatus Sulfuritelmatomonas gaucii TaxID=2043161 RepID=A0A2N9M0J0_9BACT|nr:membrane hypothetical protein [Candidatus Sulfotelmatomonas gaucii]
MHFHFDFSANQVLWTLTFAGLLVLLVVLLGRNRAQRFPWFTAAMVMMALCMVASRLLFGRMSPLVSSQIFLVLSDIATIIALLVVVEIARRAFKGAKRNAWIAATLITLALASVVLVEWGPWPSPKTMFAASTLAAMRFMQLFSQKGDLLADLLIVELGVLVVLFGRRFSAGWRSHPQQIAIGLSTVSISQLTVRVVWQHIAMHTTIHSQVEYDRVMSLQGKIYHANNAIYLAALVWWIIWLWFDEPGAKTSADSEQQIASTSEQPTDGNTIVEN